MPEQDVNIIGLESSKAPLHRVPHPFLIAKTELRLDKDLVSLSLEGFSYHLLVTTPHIRRCRIEKIDSEIKGPKHHGGVTAIHHTHPDRCHLQPCPPKGAVFKRRYILCLCHGRTRIPEATCPHPENGR